MCYSAQIERDWRKNLRVIGTEATPNLDDFLKKYCSLFRPQRLFGIREPLLLLEQP